MVLAGHVLTAKGLDVVRCPDQGTWELETRAAMHVKDQGLSSRIEIGVGSAAVHGFFMIEYLYVLMNLSLGIFRKEGSIC